MKCMKSGQVNVFWHGMAKINYNNNKKWKRYKDSLLNEMKKQKKKHIGIAIHYTLNSVKNSNDFPTTKSCARWFFSFEK